MFVRVTEETSGEERLVNLEHVMTVQPLPKGGTRFDFVQGTVLRATTEYKTVCAAVTVLNGRTAVAAFPFGSPT